MALCFSSWILLAVVLWSWAHGALLPSPLDCLHRANTTPLPGTDLQSLILSAHPHLIISGCVVHWWCYRWFLRFSLYFLSAWLLLFSLRSLTQLISLSGGFPVCWFLSSFTAPSQDCWSHPESFFSPFSLSPFSLVVLPSYIEGFLPFFGGLNPYAIVQ